MDYSDCSSVAIAEIDQEDNCFRISTSDPRKHWWHLSSKVGLITPPICLAGGEKYRIVTGFSRIKACEQLGWTRIPARCLQADTPVSQVALIAVAEAISQAPFNIIEQSRAVGLLTKGFGSKTDWYEAAKSIGFMVNPQLVQKLLRVAD